MIVLPTEYSGIQMRSRSEARFAKWCDDHNLKWIYEPEGFASGAHAYLPDFLLPEIRCFVEVKPAVFIGEISRMLPIVANRETFSWTFLVVAMEPDIRPLLFWEEWYEDFNPDSRREDMADWEGNFSMMWCRVCSKPIFCSWGGWGCRHCGCYDGNAHLMADYESTLRPAP